MLVTLAAATLDIQPGVRLSIRPDGVIEIAPDADANKPVEPASAHNCLEQRPAPVTLKHISQEVEEAENQLLQSLLDADDPYQWRSFAEVFQLALPDAETRENNKQSRSYSVMHTAIKRLVASCELDCEPVVAGRTGPGTRLKYRLSKPGESEPQPASQPSSANHAPAEAAYSCSG